MRLHVQRAESLPHLFWWGIVQKSEIGGGAGSLPVFCGGLSPDPRHTPSFSGFCEDPLFLVSVRTRFFWFLRGPGAGLAPESRYNRLHGVAEALESLVVVPFTSLG